MRACTWCVYACIATYMHAYLFMPVVRICAFVCVRVRALVVMCACVRARARVCVWVRVCMSIILLCVCARVYVNLHTFQLNTVTNIIM